MATNARGQTVIAVGEPVTRARINGLLDGIADIRPVANVTARAQLVADLAAAPGSQAPSVSRPLYVDRADAPPLAHIERTQDGTTWETLFTEAGRTYTVESAGGGNLGTTWSEASNPARLDLPPGRYLVTAMVVLSVSVGSVVRIESHLFEGATGLGVGQQCIEAIEAVGLAMDRTQDFTRLVTIAGNAGGPGSLRVQTRTSSTSGSQGRKNQSLTAIRLPG